MRRVLPAAFVVAVVCGAAANAQAQWLSGFAHKMGSAWKENNYWPNQYTPYDRCAVNTPLQTQAMKGWHRQNLFGSYHFDPVTHELNTAGENKVRQILTQSLPDRQMMFVERGLSPEITQSRIDSVQQAAVRVLPDGQLPDVAETNMILEGWPAQDAEAVAKGWEGSRPQPRLPAASSESADTGENQ